MNDYLIVTDSNSDMLLEYTIKNNIVELELTYLMGDNSYFCNDLSYTRAEFYAQMRDGAMPKTSAVNMGDATATLAPLLEQGHDLLCIMFSSALSATYNNVSMAATELREKYPEREIIVIDSLCASSGGALLVSRAVEYKRTGLSLGQVAECIRNDSPRIANLITVDDLFHLHRGGRVSKASAIIGSALGIKPMLHVDHEGRLIPTGKVRGRKKSLLTLVEDMEKKMSHEHCNEVFISHGDCLEDAQFVADEIKKRFGIEKFTINYIGPTVGAHSGPGTVALFFYADVR